MLLLKFGPYLSPAARGLMNSVITFYVFFSDKTKREKFEVLPRGIFQEEKFFKIENRFALDKTLFKPILKFRLRILIY